MQLVLIFSKFRAESNAAWTTTITTIASFTSQSSYQSQAEFHILIPADKSNANLCKSILSASVLGYPTPTLYNWNSIGEPLMAKITAASDYIQNLDEQHDEDLILIMDGFDMWLQLSPKIIIDRYHEINEDANQRIRRQLKEETGRDVEIDQRIVFSSQKKCWPGTPDDIKCSEVYDSPLPRDIYGPHTDQLSHDLRNPYFHFRQRYLNAGFIMGRVREMRLLWDRAMEKASADLDADGHDQNVFASILGEQNHQRQFSSITDWARSIASRNESFTDSKPFTPVAGTNYEFGLGLDYNASLSLPTVFAEYDANWITFSNATTIDVANEANNVTDAPYGVEYLQDDIATDKPPFHVLSTSANLTGQLPRPDKAWVDVSLFTDLWTGITPAIIHHNAHRDFLKARRKTTWPDMWFQPYARALMQARLNRTDNAPLAIDNAGRHWYAPALGDSKFLKREAREWGAWTDNGSEKLEWQSWNDLCNKEAQEEVFRDGKSIWRDG